MQDIGDAERRLVKRSAVLSAGKLTFGRSVLDCVILDISPRGARARFGTMQALPQEVRLQFASGARYRAERRWARGVEAGFALEGRPQLTDPAAIAVARAYDMVRGLSVHEPASLLKACRYQEDPELQDAADRAELGLREFEGVLARLLRRDEA